MKKQRVVIVGGGVSGLACASNLLASDSKNEFEITILESRKRIGEDKWDDE